MKNYKSMFAKSFVLGSNFNFVKGFLANMLVIIILQLYCNLAQSFYEIITKKCFSYIN